MIPACVVMTQGFALSSSPFSYFMGRRRLVSVTWYIPCIQRRLPSTLRLLFFRFKNCSLSIFDGVRWCETTHRIAVGDICSQPPGTSSCFMFVMLLSIVYICIHPRTLHKLFGQYILKLTRGFIKDSSLLTPTFH